MTLVMVTVGDETTEFWFCNDHDHNLLGMLSNWEEDCKKGVHTRDGAVAGLAKYLTRTPEASEELWSNIFGGGWDTLPWWSDFVYFDGADWDRIGRVRLTALDPDSGVTDEVSKTLGIDDLATAYARCITAGYVDACTGRPITLDLTNTDACVSDTVLQMAVLGEVVYS